MFPNKRKQKCNYPFSIKIYHNLKNIPIGATFVKVRKIRNWRPPRIELHMT